MAKKKKYEFNHEEFYAHMKENGADWLKKHVPDASPFACKIAEILKICVVGGLLRFENRFFYKYKHSVEYWRNNNFLEVSIPAGELNGNSEEYNKLFMMLHLCNEMGIQCYVSGNSFGYLSLIFRRKIVWDDCRPLTISGKSCEIIKLTESFIASCGGCKIEDMAEHKKLKNTEIIGENWKNPVLLEGGALVD